MDIKYYLIMNNYMTKIHLDLPGSEIALNMSRYGTTIAVQGERYNRKS